MKTVSQSKSRELEDAGWVKWLPAPTMDELLQEVSYDDLFVYWKEHEPKYGSCKMSTSFAIEFWVQFSKWLYATVRDPDRMADVWIKRRKRDMKLTVDIKILCTCGQELRIIREEGDVITIAPCPECRREEGEK